METAVLNCKCNLCGDIFAKVKQVRPHIIRKHPGNPPESWHRTSDPITREKADGAAKLAARAAHVGLIGPLKCLYCGHIANTVRGMGAHIGHMHKDIRTDIARPILVGTDFEDLRGSVPVKPGNRGKRGIRGPYKPRRPKNTADQQIRRALVEGEPSVMLEFPLSVDITIQVPLLLGPPVFIERNGNG